MPGNETNRTCNGPSTRWRAVVLQVVASALALITVAGVNPAVAASPDESSITMLGSGRYLEYPNEFEISSDAQAICKASIWLGGGSDGLLQVVHCKAIGDRWY